MYDIEELWLFLPLGYCLTIFFEIPVLLVGLAKVHSLRERLIAGFGLTAFTYPVVVLVLPLIFAQQPTTFMIVAEIFAPLAECWLFALLFHTARVSKPDRLRNYAAIVVANLVSFGCGELLKLAGWL
ncbi:MAG: hypothetical protein AAF456_03685 [Planctomycetota bacterium]